MTIQQQMRIQLVAKETASPEIRSTLDDIQDTMGIPWAPALWRAYAMYPEVMRLFWERLKPAVATEPFLEEALHITSRVYGDVPGWYIPSHDISVTDDQRPHLQWEQDAFAFGNPQLLIQQSALNRLFQGQVAGKDGPVEPRREESAFRMPEVSLVSEEQSPEEVKKVFQDIKHTLQTPLVNSDYQAMAKWPDFLTSAWTDVKAWRDRLEYRRLRHQVSEWGNSAAFKMVPAVSVHPQEVRDILGNESEMDNLRRVMQLFCRVLPELLIDDAMFRFSISVGQQVIPPGPGGRPAPSS